MDKKYYEQVGLLIEDLKEHEKEILDLALNLDTQIKNPEKLRKINENLFFLWEEAVKYNATLRRLEELEEERYKQLIKGESDE